jgi:hypothetical protein
MNTDMRFFLDAGPYECVFIRTHPRTLALTRAAPIALQLSAASQRCLELLACDQQRVSFCREKAKLSLLGSSSRPALLLCSSSSF